MSQTLDKWIYGEKYVKEREVKKYFFIKWDNNYLPDECVWLEKKPENINFSKEITWNIFGIKEKINLVGFLDFSSKKQKKQALESDIINEKILKSNLQKCIRRGYTDKALRTANQYMEVNIISFLRRISVIMLEDVVLHESFNVIMWLICCGDSYEINPVIKSYLLGVVYFLSECKYIERINKVTYNFYNDIKKINELNDKGSSLLYSLCLRTSYGGMNGDIKMFQSFIKLWLQYFEREKNKINLLNEKIRPIRVNDEMTIQDIHFSSIDFHIFPVVKNIKKDYPEYEEEQIKECIWYNRSSITNKKCINSIKKNKRYEEIYKNIENKLNKLSYFYIRKYFDKE
tara:strand:+ start:232 stop:1263 length:1032 start_codon:yes stop_codon:yes gene_type:complete